MRCSNRLATQAQRARLSRSTPDDHDREAANSPTFSDQLVTTNNNGPITYVETIASGTTSDPNGDVGTSLSRSKSACSFGLAVVGERQGQRLRPRSAINLSSPVTAGTVTFIPVTGTPSLNVSAGGLLTTSGPLRPRGPIARPGR